MMEPTYAYYGRVDPAPPIFLFAVLSVAIGAVSGAAGTYGMAAGSLAGFGAFFGGAIGLFFAPFLVCAGRYHGAALAVAVVAPPSVLGAWVGGLLAAPNGGPFIAFALSVLAFAGASVGLAMWRRPPRRRHAGACPACGYDLTGAPGPVCPKCGAARSVPPVP